MWEGNYAKWGYMTKQKTARYGGLQGPNGPTGTERQKWAERDSSGFEQSKMVLIT